MLSDTGFVNITVQKEKQIVIPDEILSNYLSSDELKEFKEEGKGVYSITIYAERPDKDYGCGPEAKYC